jgi:hypothetical protein
MRLGGVRIHRRKSTNDGPTVRELPLSQRHRKALHERLNPFSVKFILLRDSVRTFRHRIIEDIVARCRQHSLSTGTLARAFWLWIQGSWRIRYEQIDRPACNF